MILLLIKVKLKKREGIVLGSSCRKDNKKKAKKILNFIYYL